MKELLEQWSRLEPARCRPEGEVLHKGRWWVVVPVEGSDYDESRVQSAVQEAIGSHDWRWTGGSGYSALKHSVTIYGARPDCPFLKQAWSDESFADAMLEAYVEAFGQELDG